jgi:ornithine cyclodeaminase/alanine dehydrogenase-like protein (mu-crystallin family)
MKKNQILYLSQNDVINAGLPLPNIVEALKDALKQKGQGHVEMPPKANIHIGTNNSFLNAMPAHLPKQKAAGMKWVGGFPENPKRGLPYISGLIILNDTESLQPIAMMDCTWITATRTAAASALSATYLARPESSTLGILGCGVQGRSHVAALTQFFPLKKIKAYDVDPLAVKKFTKDIQAQFDCQTEPANTPYEAVDACDIVVTAGPISQKPHATIQAGWMARGSFASMVDYDSYWHAAALAQADKFCTDDTQQMHHYQTIGYFQNIPKIHADLGELVTGTKPGRETEEEITMAANLGMALEDMAVAKLIFDRAKATDIGTWLDL